MYIAMFINGRLVDREDSHSKQHITDLLRVDFEIKDIPRFLSDNSDS